ncbi:hypothetical protein BHE74_00034863 [Ensete ventricosum]|nr:hypothetical protein BHE74_00034863 [Ensete ventricosum]
MVADMKRAVMGTTDTVDMAHDDLAATSSLSQTTGPPTWSTRRGKLVGRRYGGANGRAIDLAQVRSNPQRSYGRPDTGKANTLTCGRMPHRKDDGRGGGVRRHGKPQGQSEPREMVVAADRTVWVTVTRIEGVKSKRLIDESRTLPQALVPPHIQICFAGSTASVALRVTGCMGEKVVGAHEK